MASLRDCIWRKWGEMSCDPPVSQLKICCHSCRKKVNASDSEPNCDVRPSTPADVPDDEERHQSPVTAHRHLWHYLRPCRWDFHPFLFV